MSLFSDVITAFFVAYRLRKIHNGARDRFWTLLAWVFVGIFFHAILRLVGEGFGYEVAPKYTVGYGICFWVGRIALVVPCWMFALYIFSLGRTNRGLTAKSEIGIRQLFEESQSVQEGNDARNTLRYDIRKIFADQVTSYFKDRADYFGDERSRDALRGVMKLLDRTLEEIDKYNISEKPKP